MSLVLLIASLYALLTGSSGLDDRVPCGSADERLSCPSGQTCCDITLGYGCCPGPQATCCPDKAHCCPGSSRCIVRNATFVCERASPEFVLAAASVVDLEHSHSRPMPSGLIPLLQPTLPAPAKKKQQHSSPPQPHSELPCVQRFDFGRPGRASAEPLHTVASQDQSIKISISADSGAIVAYLLHGVPLSGAGTAAATELALPCETVRVSAPSGGCVNVTRIYVVPPSIARTADSTSIPLDSTVSEPLGCRTVAAVETFCPAATAITTAFTVLPACDVPFTVPIITTFAFPADIAAAHLRWWAPWDRGSYHQGPWIDPLRPSDGRSGFWNGDYKYGSNAAGGAHSADFVVAPLVAVLHPSTDTGLIFAMSPSDRGTVAAEAWLQGFAAPPSPRAVLSPSQFSRLGDPATPTAATSGFAWHREQIRIGTQEVSFTAILAASAACFRPALALHMKTWPSHWKPVATSDRVKTVAGLGSYGSFPSPRIGEGTLDAVCRNEAAYRKLGYKVNWDLSGRFYHYMGMYAPPPPPGLQNLPSNASDNSDSFQWLNRWNPFGAAGGRLTYNVSYGYMDELYAAAQRCGFATLSYCNVQEFGMDVSYPLPPRQIPSPDDFRNATRFAANYLSSAALDYHWNANSRTTGTTNPRAWDGGILMDPGESSYKQFMCEQMKRRNDLIPHFQGIVVDRSDYVRYYNLRRDDGVSFVAGKSAYSMKTAYVDTIGAMREVVGPNRVMLMNSYGYASLSLMEHYDGTFSEGYGYNAAGLLTAGGMPAVMWTYDASDLGGTAATADVYFQARLLVGVSPMAPVEQPDHSIGAGNSTVAGWYEEYSQLFTLVSGKPWVLSAHAIVLPTVEDSERGILVSSAAANAFHLDSLAILYVIVMIDYSISNSTIPVELKDVPSDVKSFTLLYPGAASWAPLQPQNARRDEPGVWVLTVPLPTDRAHRCVAIKTSTTLS